MPVEARKVSNPLEFELQTILMWALGIEPRSSAFNHQASMTHFYKALKTRQVGQADLLLLWCPPLSFSVLNGFSSYAGLLSYQKPTMFSINYWKCTGGIHKLCLLEIYL